MDNQEKKIIKTKKEILPFLANNNVPQIIWCYWAGEPMNENRQRSLAMMKDHMEVPICLVTEANIHEFVLEKHPLHEVFPHLSSVHQSDYFRIYLMHHYGGCWHDIKPTKVSYKPAWKAFNDPTIYLVGKPEIKGGPAKVFDGNNHWMPEYWKDLVATNRWVARAYTPFSEELYDAVNRLLDENCEKLKKNPAKHAYDKMKKRFFFTNKYQYPLPWTVFGNLFHPLNYKYRQNISRNLPFDQVENLGLPYR
jgi:hypothetical protein